MSGRRRYCRASTTCDCAGTLEHSKKQARREIEMPHRRAHHVLTGRIGNDVSVSFGWACVSVGQDAGAGALTGSLSNTRRPSQTTALPHPLH
jgi:hypothetical protein